MRFVAEPGFSGRRRRWLLAAGLVGLVGVVGCWQLMAGLWERGQSSGDRANVLALPFTILSVVLAAVSIWVAVKERRRDLDVREAMRDLSQAVLKQQRRFLDQAFAVKWRARPARVLFSDLEPEALPEPVEVLLLSWQQDLCGAEAGSIEDVAAFYQNQPTGRLVVLGAPGSGKTVLLSRLVQDLLAHIDALPPGDLPAHVRIPVLLSLPTCDLGEVEGASSDQLAHRLQAWITARLHDDYGLRPAYAFALMQAQRILPVLDGLDEMDPSSTAADTGPIKRPRAVAVLRALNAGIRAPVVVACRHIEYGDISQVATAPAAAPTILTDARHVTLRPLDKQEIIAYLTARFHGRNGQLRSRWQPIADALYKETPLLDVLANPWQLFLAVTAYTAENTKPADLLAMSSEQVKAHLLAKLIPAVVERDEIADRHGWTAQDVTRWLSAIASHQHRTAAELGTSETDIYLPDLWRVTECSHPRWIALVLSLTPFFCMLLFYADVPGWYLAFAVIYIACIGFIVFNPNSHMARIDLGGLWTPKGRRRLRSGLVVGLVIGLTFGLVGGLVYQLAFVLPFALAFGLASALVTGLTGEVAAVSSARVLARQCLAYTMVVGLVIGLAVALVLLGFGLAGGLVVGLAFVLAIALAVGLTFGLAIGLTVGHGSVWLRYAIAVRAAARQGLLPRRPAKFLDWCLHAGLMRMSGIAIQFGIANYNTH